MQAFLIIITPRLSTEKTGKKIFTWKSFDCILSQLLSKG